MQSGITCMYKYNLCVTELSRAGRAVPFPPPVAGALPALSRILLTPGTPRFRGCVSFAQIADLVGEADLQGMEHVARVLDHLGDPDLRADDGCIDSPVHPRHPVSAPRVPLSDQGVGRMGEVGEEIGRAHV